MPITIPGTPFVLPTKLLQPVYNIVDFGADPSGVADSTNAVNAAIAAAGVGEGGTVRCPSGFFKITDTIVLNSFINFIGEGSIDVAVLHTDGGTYFFWAGVANGTMFKWGNNIRYTGMIGGFTVDMKGIGSVGHFCGAPIGTLFYDCVIINTIAGGTPFDGAVVLTTDGQLNPDGVTPVVAGGDSCTFERIGVDNNANSSFVLSGTITGGVQTAAITDMTWINCSGQNGAGANSLYVKQASDTMNFYGCGFITFGAAGSIAVLLGETSIAAGSSVYGFNFHGGFINNGASGSIGLDVRNTPVGNANYMFGTFIGGGAGGSIPYVTGAGATRGIMRAFGATFQIENVTHPTPGASPWTYTNTTIYPQEIRFVGGTISAVSLIRQGGSTAIGAAANGFVLDPGDGFTLTYSVVPTVSVIPH